MLGTEPSIHAGHLHLLLLIFLYPFLLSVQDWFQPPPETENSAYIQVPYIKWCNIWILMADIILDALNNL